MVRCEAMAARINVESENFMAWSSLGCGEPIQQTQHVVCVRDGQRWRSGPARLSRAFGQFLEAALRNAFGSSSREPLLPQQLLKLSDTDIGATQQLLLYCVDLRLGVRRK